jgi:hypothetical protein
LQLLAVPTKKLKWNLRLKQNSLLYQTTKANKSN